MQKIQDFVQRHQLQLIAAFVSAQLFILRRPDAFLHPQFWAEDGHVWYADAYNHGLSSLFAPANGYLQTISRLVANIAVFLPLTLAPLFYNTIALGFQILPVSLILSSRFKNTWPNIKVRILIALTYVLTTNPEVNVNVTNIQWHLALAAFIILIAEKPETTFWRWFDRVILVLSSLSGPFCLPLLIAALIHWWFKKKSFIKERVILIAVPAAIQITELALTGSAGRSLPAPLGASVENLVRIVSRIFSGPFIGIDNFARVYHHHGLVVGFVAFFLLLVAYALVKGSYQLRLFCFFVLMLFAASLVSPVISANLPQWQVFGNPPGAAAAQRYFLFPDLAWEFALLSIFALKRDYIAKAIAGAILLISLTYGLWHNWQYQPYLNTNFNAQVEEFNKQPKGTHFTIHINPAPWTLDLVKH